MNGTQSVKNLIVFLSRMNGERQVLAQYAKPPTLCTELIEKKKLLCHVDIDDLLEYPSPRLIICTKEFSLSELFSKTDCYTILSGIKLRSVYIFLGTFLTC